MVRAKEGSTQDRLLQTMSHVGGSFDGAQGSFPFVGESSYESSYEPRGSSICTLARLSCTSSSPRRSHRLTLDTQSDSESI